MFLPAPNIFLNLHMMSSSLSSTEYKKNLSITDIDECLAGIDGCEQQCDNTAGSYFCSCHDGYINQRGKCQGEGIYNIIGLLIIALFVVLR